MSNFKQNISKFVKGLENKLTDKIVTASNETIIQNAKRDEKCKGLKRSASSRCCVYCMEHEGTYTSSEVDAGELGGRHEACKCKVTPVFEYQTPIQKEAEKEARRLLQKANEHEIQTTALLKSLENEGRKLEGLNFRLKGKASLERKILSDATEKGCSLQEASKNIKDVLRYTFVVDEKRFYESFAEVRTTLKNKGYNLVRVKNSLKSKGKMYRGVNTIVETSDKYLFELQFHTADSLKIKEIVHPLYEQYRLLDPKSKEALALEKRMIEISDKIAIPKGAEMVKL